MTKAELDQIETEVKQVLQVCNSLLSQGVADLNRQILEAGEKPIDVESDATEPKQLD